MKGSISSRVEESESQTIYYGPRTPRVGELCRHIGRRIVEGEEDDSLKGDPYGGAVSQNGSPTEGDSSTIKVGLPPEAEKRRRVISSPPGSPSQGLELRQPPLGSSFLHPFYVTHTTPILYFCFWHPIPYVFPTPGSREATERAD